MQEDQIELDHKKMKYLIIDGYNLLHKIPYLKNLLRENPDSAQMTLLEMVKRNIKNDEKLILVLDGYSNFKSSNIIYSGNVTADEVIRSFIEEHYERDNLTVVSSDTYITDLARVCGCEVIKSEDFVKLKNLIGHQTSKGKKNEPKDEADEKPTSISKSDLDEFKKYFS